jgi:hypothetical protein
MEWMEAKMVKVTFKNIKEIVIHEAIQHELKDFIKIRITGLKKETIAQPLVWAEGVVFSRNTYPPTEEVVKDGLEGLVHFSSVEWALLPKYRRYLKFRGAAIPVINVSANPNLRDVAKALKPKRKKSK